MLVALLIFTAQLALVFFKHLGIRAIAQHRVGLTAIYTALIQVSWLISSALGINALLNFEWLNVIAYIIGGVVGSYLQFKINIRTKS